MSSNMNWIFPLLTVSLYFQDFPPLQKEERWEEIIDLGESDLKSATDPFYQGDFEKAAQHTSLWYQMAIELDDSKEKTHGLYLLSALARTKGDFEKARKIALSALAEAKVLSASKNAQRIEEFYESL